MSPIGTAPGSGALTAPARLGQDHPVTSPATRAHDALTALLALAIVPDPAGRHRRTADFAGYVPHQQRADAVMRRLAPALPVASTGSGLLAARR